MQPIEAESTHNTGSMLSAELQENNKMTGINILEPTVDAKGDPTDQPASRRWTPLRSFGMRHMVQMSRCLVVDSLLLDIGLVPTLLVLGAFPL